MSNSIQISKLLKSQIDEYKQVSTKIHHLNKCKFSISEIHKILNISYQHSNNTINNPTKNPREKVNIENVNKYLKSINKS